MVVQFSPPSVSQFPPTILADHKALFRLIVCPCTPFFLMASSIAKAIGLVYNNSRHTLYIYYTRKVHLQLWQKHFNLWESLLYYAIS